ncbi:hypothetical protein [Pseudomonas sp. R5(2019)]|uniref:hypothetical protein n=1 Tax=Pseudomonas sp. R5(2019) TaxID=2697566 RepID=UPI00141348FB|nr:hypothetical protein [Pseudomonas sp. R5(2019)]NBA95272.1 hypothetical protein [Pseudomonas sp. R5(2019)]
MNLTIDLLSLGGDDRNFIEVGNSRITKIMETGVTDLYEVRMGPAKLVFVLGKSPRATFRVLSESDVLGVLEVFGHCTSFSIECSHSDVYKFELFMRLDVQLACEVTLYNLIQEFAEELKPSTTAVANSSTSKAA